MAASIRRMASLPIVAYQRFISPAIPRRCKYEPTCSAYAAQSIAEYGILRGERDAAQSSGRRTNGLGGKRAQSQRSERAVACADVVRSPRNPRSNGEPLATLVAAALEQCSAGARAHPPTESVRTSALTFLGLVGPLHLGKEHSRPRSKFAFRKSLCRQMRTSLRHRPSA